MLIIRPETEKDVEAIDTLTRIAFSNHTHSHQTEQDVIESLRKSAALSVSLVAEDDGEIVGHIAFSKVSTDDDAQNWFGLGPMAVSPNLQKKGIGTRLVEAGLSELVKMDAQGCVVLGDPHFYGRFGFERKDQTKLKGMPPEYFLSLLMNGENHPSGYIRYHASFSES